MKIVKCTFYYTIIFQQGISGETENKDQSVKTGRNPPQPTGILNIIANKEHRLTNVLTGTQKLWLSMS